MQDAGCIPSEASDTPSFARSEAMVHRYTFSLSSNSTAKERLLDARGRTHDVDDTESVNEEDLLDFVESDDAVYQGAFVHYSRKAAMSSSSDELYQSVQSHNQRRILTELNSQRISGLHDELDPAYRHIGGSAVNSKANSRKVCPFKKNSLSIRDNLLAEAWERKRWLWLSQEPESFNKYAVPESLRHLCSASDEQNMKVSFDKEARNLRTRGLTDDDFEELRGFMDLNFRFNQSAVPELCKMLPALEVYCAVAQSFQGSPIPSSPVAMSPTPCPSRSSFPSWRVASPGDDPNVVKEKLRHWAQAVACHARLCS